MSFDARPDGSVPSMRELRDMERLAAAERARARRVEGIAQQLTGVERDEQRRERARKRARAARKRNRT